MLADNSVTGQPTGGQALLVVLVGEASAEVETRLQIVPTCCL